MNLKRHVNILVSIMILQLAAMTGQADTIDYRFSSSPNDVTTLSYNYGGVTVTGGPGALFVNVSNGLSIIGDNNFSIDVGESIDFSFDAGSATGISLFTQGGPTGVFDIVAYGLSGSLGTQSVSVTGLGPAVDVSGLFGNVAIEHFTMTTTTGAHRVYILNFDPVASVPDTAPSCGLLASGLVLLAAARRRIQTR